jgi:hypothetical protein
MLKEELLGGGIDSMIHKRTEARRRYVDVPTLQGIAHHDFSGGAAADVAYADEQDVIEHYV